MTGRDDPDDPAAEWGAGDTVVELHPHELLDFAAEEPTPVLPGFEPGVLAGIELGEQRGAARVLHAVRDHLAADGAEPGIAEAILQALADAAGVTLG